MLGLLGIIGLGLICLVVGAEFLVRGASRLAGLAGISSLVIGLTVVAFGTSAPELAVSLQAALAEQSDISLGNVVGSNIFNVLTILGVSALIVPLTISRQLVRFDVLVMIGASILIFLLGLDGKIGKIDGVIFLILFSLYIAALIRLNRRNRDQSEVGSIPGVKLGPNGNAKSIFVQIMLVVGGLVLLVLGSKCLVHGAVGLARLWEVSELVIGLTIVAAGTSLPELFTSVVAGIRGERDIAVGNIVGSNIFNILAILGVSSLFAPNGIIVANSVLHVDIPVMLIVALACLPIFFTGMVIDRWEGSLFLSYYILYTVYLFLIATGHPAQLGFTRTVIYVAFPITATILIIHVIRAYRRQTHLLT